MEPLSGNFKNMLAGSNFGDTSAGLKKQPTRRYSTKQKPIDAKYFLGLQTYDSNCKILKEFIQSNFRDDELIDYDQIHKIELRNSTNFSYKELDQEFTENS